MLIPTSPVSRPWTSVRISSLLLNRLVLSRVLLLQQRGGRGRIDHCFEKLVRGPRSRGWIGSLMGFGLCCPWLCYHSFSGRFSRFLIEPRRFFFLLHQRFWLLFSIDSCGLGAFLIPPRFFFLPFFFGPFLAFLYAYSLRVPHRRSP